VKDIIDVALQNYPVDWVTYACSCTMKNIFWIYT